MNPFHSLINPIEAASALDDGNLTSGRTIIDVTMYGAIPNDQAEDSVAIQLAINGAPPDSAIYFPEGTYLISGVTINNRNRLMLLGAGSTRTILKRTGTYPNMFESADSTDLVITRLAFDTNGIGAYGGFLFYNAKRVTIRKNRFFDSNRQPVGSSDRYAWVFGRGSAPSQDVVITDNLIEDLQLEVDFGRRVLIEGNTVVRPVNTSGIGVFTVADNTPAQDYTIQHNTILDPVVSGAGIAIHLDPPNSQSCLMKDFKIQNNNIVFSKNVGAPHANAIRLGTGDSTVATNGNVFDQIMIQDNIVYKDPAGAHTFADVNSIIFGNSSSTANFKFANTSVINNRIFFNNSFLPNVDIRQQGVKYVESNNRLFEILTDIMPPSVPTAVTAVDISRQGTRLEWNASVDNRDVAGYRVYRNGVEVAIVGATFYENINLSPKTSYTYRVLAVDGAGNKSEQSYAIAARTSR
jgi:hypothetical protein